MLLLDFVLQDSWQNYQALIFLAIALLAIESLLIAGLLRERRRKKSHVAVALVLLVVFLLPVLNTLRYLFTSL